LLWWGRVQDKHVNNRDIFGIAFELEAINPARVGNANRVQNGAVKGVGGGCFFLLSFDPSRTGLETHSQQLGAGKVSKQI
jgi:hypothetical protein